VKVWTIHPAAQEEHDELIMRFGDIDEALAVAFEARYLHYRHEIIANPRTTTSAANPCAA
jgi:hypothetical protein